MQKKLHARQMWVNTCSAANQREARHGTERIGRFPSALRRGVHAWNQRPLPLTAMMKARQSSKIRELAEAVISAGFLTLDEQAKALGLSRSTAWTVRKTSHKASGLTASIINRMLAAPELPPLAPIQDLRIRRGKGCRLIWRKSTSRALRIRSCAIERSSRAAAIYHSAERSPRARSWTARLFALNGFKKKQEGNTQPVRPSPDSACRIQKMRHDNWIQPTIVLGLVKTPGSSSLKQTSRLSPGKADLCS
jgi:hypothetical protein